VRQYVNDQAVDTVFYNRVGNVSLDHFHGGSGDRSEGEEVLALPIYLQHHREVSFPDPTNYQVVYIEDHMCFHVLPPYWSATSGRRLLLPM